MADEKTERGLYDDMGGTPGQEPGTPDKDTTDGKPRDEPTKGQSYFPPRTPRGGQGCLVWWPFYLVALLGLAIYLINVLKVLP